MALPPSESEPRIEDVLDFVLRYELDRAAGRLLSSAQYEDLFPQSRTAVRAEFERLEARQPNQLAETTRVERLDHYVLERELGSGGQGRVFLAFDTRMRRRVALKVLTRAHLSPDSLARFRREVEIIAKLDHPGLCTVFEAELDGPRPYLAMRYVDGLDLAGRIREAKAKKEQSGVVGARTSDALADLLRLFEDTARALSAAHEAGVIHRDVKPANILVGASGQPVIVDFGLARDEDSDADTLTRTGDVLGTPAYMAPELLESGHASSIDRRADVYALGVALYECLTLERPFVGTTRDGVFRQIRDGRYPDPRDRNPLVSADLRVVLATAMDLDPGRRYTDALALAEDLRRLRVHEPIRARPAGWPVRVRRWAQRQPRLAGAIAVILAVIATAIVGLYATVQRVEAESTRTRAANERLLGVAFRERSQSHVGSDPGFALRLAIEGAARDPGPEANGTLLRALEASRELRSLWCGPETGSACGTLDADGDRILVGTQARVHLFEASRSEPVRSSAKLFTRLRRVLFSPDGSRVAAIDEAGAWILDGHTLELLTRIHAGPGPLESCEFSPDGQRLVTCHRAGLARVYDARDARAPREMITIQVASGFSTHATFDPTGTMIVVRADARVGRGVPEATDFHPRAYDAASGRPLAEYAGSTSPVRDIGFARGGTRLVVATVDEGLFCWETPSARLAWHAPLPGTGWCMSVDPSGARVAVGFDSGVQVFDVDSGSRILDLVDAHDRAVMNVAFSPDGRRIASIDYGGGVATWDATTGESPMRARSQSAGQGGLAWLSDSARFATSAGIRVANVWSTRDDPWLPRYRVGTAPIRAAAFAPDSLSVLTASEDGIIALHAAGDGTELWRLDAGTPLAGAWFVAGTSEIAALARDGTFMRLQPGGGARHVVLTARPPALCSFTVASDGSRAILGFADGRVQWLDVLDLEILRVRGPGGAPIELVALDPSGARAAFCDRDGRGGILARDAGQDQDFDWTGTGQRVHALAFSADGATLHLISDAVTHAIVTVADPGRRSVVPSRPAAALVPLRSGAMLEAYRWTLGLELRSATDGTLAWSRADTGVRGRWVDVRVHPSERSALVTSTSGVAVQFALEDGARMACYEHGTAALTAAAYSPDGRSLVTAAADGSVRVWPVDPLLTALEAVPAPAAVWADSFPRTPVDD